MKHRTYTQWLQSLTLQRSSTFLPTVTANPEPIRTTMTTLKTARIGSISTGTLRTEDLLSTFISELEGLMLVNGDYFSRPENHGWRNRLCDLIGEAQDYFAEDGESLTETGEDNAPGCVDALSDALNEFSPPYCYFGHLEGDGSDFGFWVNHAAIDDLPCISDNSEEAIAAEQSESFSTDVRYVNDHGNTTVYGADGSVLLELV